MVGLNQALRGHGRVENLFEDADLQMAGFAAALRVLTGYTHVDGIDIDVPPGTGHSVGESWLLMVPVARPVVSSPGACPW